MPPGSFITVVGTTAAPPAGTFAGSAVTLNGLTALENPGTNVTATLDSPTVVVGTTVNPATGVFPNALGVGQLPNVIQASASCHAGAVICGGGVVNTADLNPVIAMQLQSANSFAFNTAPAVQYIDLTGTNNSAPGTQFQVVSGGVGSTTTAGYLGQFSLISSVATLDARFGNPCCNNTGNTIGGNTPLAGTATVAITGDFQTIIAAYLRQGNQITQGAQAVEQNPTANGTCTPSTAGGDILSNPLPLATGQQSITFSVPTAGNPLPNASVAQVVNIPVYALCVITNGTNVIADTFTNSPSSAALQVAAGGSPGSGTISGAIGGGGVIGTAGVGTNWTVTVAGTGFPSLVLVRNTHPGFDIAYAGTKVTFTNVFPASSGFPTFVRLVNTGVGTSPMFAVIQKDGLGPSPVPGSFAAMTPFAAFYVLADSIAAQAGTTLSAHSTFILLTPSATL
jgi:hypothetical protein